MKAVSYISPELKNVDDRLYDIVIPDPTLRPHDVLVKIDAISVNPVDTKVKKREFKAGSKGILGWDAVGEIVALGETATKFNIGDKVWYAGDLTRDGSNAEFQAVDERIISLKPKTLDNVQAAALPLTALTAWEMIFDRFVIKPETTGTIMIIGGAGGVGSIAIQLLKAKTQLTVIATASREETQQWVKELGADFVLDHTKDFYDQLSSFGIETVDYIFSTNATDTYLEQIVKVITPQGKLGLIDDPISFDIMPLKLKSISTHWELMFTRSMYQTSDIENQGKILAELASLVDDGKVRTTADRSFGTINADNLLLAHKLIESGQSKGKITLHGF